jgi:superfamily II DNA/RNA helicase
VAHVVNLDLPKTMEDHVYGIGRIGRAGISGIVMTFVKNSFKIREF